MLIFAETLPPRVLYAFQVLLDDLCDTLRFTCDPMEYESYTGAKIWYSLSRPSGGGVHLQSGSMLFQLEFNRVRPEACSWGDLPGLFPVSGGDIPFDLPGAVFFLVTRMEEYWSFQSDDMGRFTADSSLSNRLALLDRPIIDEWRLKLYTLLEERNSGLNIPRRKFSFLSTIDIDHAYAYLHKGAARTVGALARDLLQGKVALFRRRMNVLRRKERDPYDTFDYMDAMHEKYNIVAKYFFLVGDHGEFDTGLSYEQKDFRLLLQRISKKHETGLHPSVGSHRRYSTITREKSRLEHIIGKPCTSSRQHYLLLRFRTTYRLLKAAGIRHDYTMGYADNVGFRAGTARPFRWFDLKKDEATELTVHPLMVMDATLRKYLQLEPTAAKALTRRMVEATARVGGEFVCLWHNETLCNEGDWKGWREVWEYTLSLAGEFER
jgi:hypothetical protein